jgi:hypothetical protein
MSMLVMTVFLILPKIIKNMKETNKLLKNSHPHRQIHQRKIRKYLRLHLLFPKSRIKIEIIVTIIEKTSFFAAFRYFNKHLPLEV